MPSPLHVRRVFDFNPNIHGWKRPRGRHKTRWAESIKHDLHSAGLDTINAAQMVYDRPQWKAFVCGLPTLEPKHGPSQVSQVSYLVYTSISIWCVVCLAFRLCPCTGASIIHLSTWPSSLLFTCPYHRSFFYAIFFVTICTFTGVTFTDPLTCSFLIVSYIVTPTSFAASSSRPVYVFGF